jgi:hypothetical protein
MALSGTELINFYFLIKLILSRLTYTYNELKHFRHKSLPLTKNFKNSSPNYKKNAYFCSYPTLTLFLLS